MESLIANDGMNEIVFLNKKEKKELFLPTISDYIKEDEKKGKK